MLENIPITPCLPNFPMILELVMRDGLENKIYNLLSRNLVNLSISQLVKTCNFDQQGHMLMN